jgi:site-specific DNA-methyltransferase (adenine-specific)
MSTEEINTNDESERSGSTHGHGGHDDPGTGRDGETEEVEAFGRGPEEDSIRQEIGESGREIGHKASEVVEQIGENPIPTARRDLDENGAKRDDGTRHVGTHSGQDAGEARRKVSRERKERKGRENAERVRGAGDRLEALIIALRNIEGVVRGHRKWCVIHADCLDIMRCLPDRLVTHVITDPPYEAEAHTLNRRLKTTSVDGAKWQRRGGETKLKPIDFEPLTPESRAAYGAAIAIAVQRWAIVFCQCEANVLWKEALRPLDYKRTCAWVKPDGMPQLTGDRPGMGYESFVCAHTTGRSEWNGGGRHGVFTHIKEHSGGAAIRNDHPTTKPIALMIELVSLFTNPGDLILDPFAGSGTTGIAALRTGRRCVLIEKDPVYAQLCVDRLTSEENSSTLREYRAGQLPLVPA